MISIAVLLLLSVMWANRSSKLLKSVPGHSPYGYEVKQAKKHVVRACWSAIIATMLLLGAMVFLYQKNSPLLKEKEVPAKQVGIFYFLRALPPK